MRWRFPAYISRQPLEPHAQTGPEASTVMWPISPAQPCMPEKTWPSTTMAAPMPISPET